jgi:hypothetical protein
MPCDARCRHRRVLAIAVPAIIVRSSVQLVGCSDAVASIVVHATCARRRCHVVTVLLLASSPGCRSPVRSHRAPSPLGLHRCLRPAPLLTRFSFVDKVMLGLRCTNVRGDRTPESSGLQRHDTTFVPGQPERALCIISIERSSIAP